MKVLFPHKTIWCYTGNHYESEILQPGPPAGAKSPTNSCSTWMCWWDGDFVQDKYDISLRFRGSSNQRIIDLNRTRAAGHVVLWEDDPIFSTHTM